MNDIAIKVSNLSKVYKLYDTPTDRLKEALHPLKKQYHNDFYALNNINFEIKKGETVGIIGKNGAGKSTLLKIITGVLSPSSGSVQVNGRISSLLELGAGFNPEYTGMENIYLQGTLMGYSHEEMQAKIDDILAFADIGEFIHQPVKSYSSGMFARLAFAVAINVEPDILIVDEALSVGDMRFQQKCFRKFKELQDAKKTILFVTHDTGAIINYCSQVIWINEGRKHIEGIPDDVCKKYISFMAYGLESTTENSESRAISALDANIEEIKSSAISKADLTNTDLNSFLKQIPESAWVSTEGAERFGDGKAKIIEACFVDTKYRKISQLQGSETLILGLKVNCYRDLNNVIFGMIIKDSKGNNIYGTNTYVEEQFFDQIKHSKKSYSFFFVFDMPKIACGEYSLTTSVATGSQLIHEQHDWLHDLFTFSMVTGDMRQKIGLLLTADSPLFCLQKN